MVNSRICPILFLFNNHNQISYSNRKNSSLNKLILITLLIILGSISNIKCEGLDIL